MILRLVLKATQFLLEQEVDGDVLLPPETVVPVGCKETQEEICQIFLIYKILTLHY